jgi:pyruvate dehydrogenase E2 component (dihydrolipoamide acetyltransferase)
VGRVPEGAERRVPLTGVRRAMFDAMTRAAQVPQASTGFSARAEALEALQSRLAQKTDTKISYLALVIKAVLPALRRYPVLNATVDAHTAVLIEKYVYHIGFAAHTDAGLMVPVVRDAGQLDLIALSERIARLAGLARERRLGPNEARGSTFTITNWGSHTGRDTFGTPIVNPPEVAILGMGRIRDEVVARDGQVVVERRMPMTLSYDHRVVDGVTAAAFMSDVLAAVEDPDLLLSRL